MAKGDIDKLKQAAEIDEKKQSMARIEKLKETLLEAIVTADDATEGGFTFYEVTDAILFVAHSYNAQALATQFKKEG